VEFLVMIANIAFNFNDGDYVMRKVIFLTGFTLVLTLGPLFAFAAPKTGLVAWWKFDEEKGKAVTDSVSGVRDRIRGNFKYVSGVAGKCLKFDEFTTAIVRKAVKAPKLNTESFSIEAWIAPQAYSWNWCPIVMKKNEDRGFYFGLDADGRFGLHVSVDGKWYECNCRTALPGLGTYHTWNSDERTWNLRGSTSGPPGAFKEKAKPVLPLLKWSHLVGTFSGKEGITIYLNGKVEGKLAVTGKFSAAEEADLYIGRDPEKSIPAHTERREGTLPFNFSFDGLVDEIRIYNHSLSAKEVQQAYERVQPEVEQPLRFRRIPTGPKGPAPFGAYYTHLKYDEDYDRPWRIGEFADVVVMFDEYPFKLVYWHGINFYPIWYSENDIGLMHEAGETGGQYNCHEAMMDRQTRYSHVRIVENTDARMVIHWRHAMNNIVYNLAHIDPLTGWGDWCDDYFTVYPDGVAARKLIVWCSRLDEEWHSFEQDNFIVQPGLWPPDILEKEGSTLANLKGEESKLSWAETGWPKGKNISDPVIQTYNIKAKSRPFMITYPGVGQPTLEGNGKPWPWCYYWWNHWPATQIPCDGRQVYVVDGRPSSTCLAGAQFRIDAPENERTENSVSQVMLFGMTMDKTAGQLAPLARSWAQPPELEIAGAGFVNEGYSIAERCYHLRAKAPGENTPLKFKLKASEDSPVVNPAFVIKNWGEMDATLTIDRKEIKRGKNFRAGHRHTLDGSDLIVWIKTESMKPVRILLSPVAG